MPLRSKRVEVGNLRVLLAGPDTCPSSRFLSKMDPANSTRSAHAAMALAQVAAGSGEVRAENVSSMNEGSTRMLSKLERHVFKSGTNSAQTAGQMVVGGGGQLGRHDVAGQRGASSVVRRPSPNGLSRRPRPPPAAIREVESVCHGTCNRDEVRSVLELFASMDQRSAPAGHISRRDFFEASKDDDTRSLERIKVLKRSGLAQRFRESAANVTLRELLGLTWPKASGHDLDVMLSWCGGVSTAPE